MAYHRDDPANYCWNDLVGPAGLYHYYRPPFHRYPGDIEFGPMHQSYPNQPRQPQPQPQPPNRRQIDIESAPSSPRQESSQSRPPRRQIEIESRPLSSHQEHSQSRPSRRQIKIESEPSSPVAPPPRQQSAPSTTQQSENEPPPPSSPPSRPTPPPPAAKKPKPLGRRGSFILFSAFLVLTIVIATFFAILRPKAPSFRLDAVTIYNFTATGAALGYRLGAEISSHNPNLRVGIYYRQLQAYAVLGPQRITDPGVPLSPAELYHGHNYSIVWPPAEMSGESVQLSVAEEANLTAELDSAGAVKLGIRLLGRLKWKVGSWTSTWWHLHVACPANLRFRDPNTGVPVGDGLRFPLGESCAVDTD